ncbi:hypothetical protein SAMN05216551_10151 [Chitinasiproducens palmae]|uniref:Uncharacterized protein n=1 Tax=Chitinasiproducens palmae TaxID=1770053 RepID=A0A1H2PKI5_9BURK|nr:hypothetical protein SAMN05216551_10151 [Chitinasiproducens palmae]
MLQRWRRGCDSTTIVARPTRFRHRARLGRLRLAVGNGVTLRSNVAAETVRVADLASRQTAWRAVGGTGTTLGAGRRLGITLERTRVAGWPTALSRVTTRMAAPTTERVSRGVRRLPARSSRGAGGTSEFGALRRRMVHSVSAPPGSAPDDLRWLRLTARSAAYESRPGFRATRPAGRLRVSGTTRHATRVRHATPARRST